MSSRIHYIYGDRIAGPLCSKFDLYKTEVLFHGSKNKDIEHFCSSDIETVTCNYCRHTYNDRQNDHKYSGCDCASCVGESIEYSRMRVLSKCDDTNLILELDVKFSEG